MTSQTFTSDIVNLNVGGTRFSTSRQTLCSVHDSFFSSLLSGRIPSCRDEHGHLFIDRDPKYFSVILNFLRTKELNLNSVDDLSALRAEAEFYAITPLVKRLLICEDLDRSLCGDVLFTGFIPPPHNLNWKNSSSQGRASMDTSAATSTTTSSNQTSTNASNNTASSNSILKPGNVLRLFNSPHQRSTSNEAAPSSSNTTNTHQKTHSRQSSSSELLNFVYNYPSAIDFANQHLNGSGGGGGVTKTGPSHSRNPSMELRQMKTGLGILLGDCPGSQFRNSTFGGGPSSSTAVTQVNLIVGHHNWIAVAYAHYVCCYKLKDGMGWQLMFQSAYVDDEIERVSIYSKYHFNHTGVGGLQSNSSGSNLASLASGSGGGGGSNTSTLAAGSNAAGHSSASSLTSHRSSSGSNLLGSLNNNNNSMNGLTSPVNHSAQQFASASMGSAPFQQPSSPQSLIASLAAAANLDSSPGSVSSSPHYQFSKLCALLAIAFKHTVRLWLVSDEIACNLIGNFNLNSSIEHLFFIGSQLVALGSVGRIGVWNSLSQLWQAQDVITPISSFDTAGSFLLLGGQNGVLYYIDMQKFPLRMKDNDLLVTELYKDPLGEPITALSVYLTPKTSNTGNWIEIAYGTSNGTIRVIVQHPETVGHGPQLFQTFSVHRGAILKVMLTEKYLVSVCSEFNHVRTWNVTRFRGMISTQPGSTPLASFKIVAIDASDAAPSYAPGNDIGPFGERDNIQLFVQKAVPFTDQLYVRVSSTGKRICTIKSVDYSNITSFCVHECEGPSRLNSRPRRYLFTGHSNGSIQLWDLTTALELKSDHSPQQQQHLGGPSAFEFVKLLDQCDLIVSNSGYSTPTAANCFSPCANLLAGSCINNNNNNNSKQHKNLLVNNSNVNLAHSSSSSSSYHPSNNDDNSSEKRLDD